MSRASVLAESIKDILNATEFSIAFTATRSYRVFYSQKDLKTLRVTVIAPAIEQDIISRAGNTDIVEVDIVIQKQVDPSDLSAVDALADLTEEVSEHFRSTGHKKWLWLGTSITTPYDIEDLSEWRVFTSVIRLRYQIAWKNV